MHDSVPDTSGSVDLVVVQSRRCTRPLLCLQLLVLWTQRPSGDTADAAGVARSLEYFRGNCGGAYGFLGSGPTVRRCVAALRKKEPEVFVPLAYEPGAEAQVDFGQAEVVIAGVRQTVHFFCMKLAYSRLPFVLALPNERQEAFFEGHRQGFEFFGGVPRRLTYDNLKATVHRILAGRDREEQTAFQALRAHYLFDSHFCMPEQGHEKGQVESLVGYVRRNALVPIPEVRSLAELNEQLRRWCEREKDRTVSGTTEPVRER